MSYHNYWSFEADEAHREGHHDGRYRRNSFDYDRHSDNEIDKTYFEGRRDEEREEERREEQRREELEQEQRDADRRHQDHLEQQRCEEIEMRQSDELQNL